MLQGVSRKDIATELKCHGTQIWQWRQLPEFQTELERQRKAISEQVGSLIGARIADEAESSLNTVIALRDGARHEGVRLKASQDLLDRAGFKAVEQVHQVTEHILSPEFADLIRKAQGEDDVVDAVVVDAIKELPERAG